MVEEQQTIHQKRNTRKSRTTCSWLSTVLALLLVLFLSACGGGVGGGGTEEEQENIVTPPPTVKTAKLTMGVKRIDNIPVSNIGTCDVDLTLPTGFVLPTDASGYPTSATSLVAGLDIVNGITYSHPTLTLRLMMGDGTTFSPGDLVSFTRTLQTNETLPVPGNIMLSLQQVSEVSGTSVTDETAHYEATLTIEEI